MNDTPTEEQINHVFKERSDQCDDGYPVCIATWSIKLGLNRLYPDQSFECVDIRKVLKKMSNMKLSEYYSRRGNSVWEQLR